jgi:hypothetical protein
MKNPTFRSGVYFAGRICCKIDSLNSKPIKWCVDLLSRNEVKRGVAGKEAKNRNVRNIIAVNVSETATHTYNGRIFQYKLM